METATMKFNRKSSFSIAHILDDKTHSSKNPTPPMAHSNAIGAEHLTQHAKISSSASVITGSPNAIAAAMQPRIGEPVPPTIANPIASASTTYSTLPPNAQYAFKHLLLKSDHAAAGGSPLMASPGALRFDPVYDPASLVYQQVLNMQKSSALFMPHFQAAATAAALTPSGYCEQYNPFMECEALVKGNSNGSDNNNDNDDGSGNGSRSGHYHGP
ncbi:uncharacterized protein LOC118737255 [Rhagoletis pomonella]|uniref:uncharacterized protein LOC118737255 n=1 Tax=Rhagoletis pomonella TaxID=28610 RepID=UPI00177FEF80|nr:uncharacterized protein LOC118737255 [Rhagoletis pomonella]